MLKCLGLIIKVKLTQAQGRTQAQFALHGRIIPLYLQSSVDYEVLTALTSKYVVVFVPSSSCKPDRYTNAIKFVSDIITLPYKC